MKYSLTFLEPALKEWKKLPPHVREQFKNKLSERLTNPRIPKSALKGMKDCYKIKLLSSGYRLVYQVFDERLVIQVIAAGKRDKNFVYNLAEKRI